VAVGVYTDRSSLVSGPLVARWNGKAWRADRLPPSTAGDQDLWDVSCVSSRWCMALGNGLSVTYS
jgi:hypothetical protein